MTLFCLIICRPKSDLLSSYFYIIESRLIDYNLKGCMIMGWFSFGKEKKCVCCGENTNMVMGSSLKDGNWICGTCKNRLNTSIYTSFKYYSTPIMKNLMDIRNKCTNCYSNTYGSIMFMDSTKKCYIMMIGVIELDYDDILGYELMEDNETVTSGGLGRAAIGGLLFGATGAVIGSITGGKTTKTTCKRISIKLIVKGQHGPSIDIPFMIAENKKDGFIYKTFSQEAQKCLSKFEVICKTRKSAPVTAQAPVSGADEILKYKQLLDMGAITQEEFDAKKKQILGL